MMKQLLAKNKIVQRVKAVKDLFLEKLDSLNHVQLEQIQKLEKLNQLDPLDFKVEQLNNSTEQIRQENAETKRKADLSLQNQAFLLKFSVDIVKNLQLLTEDWKQKGDLILNTLLKNHEDSQKTAYQQSSLILDAVQKIQEANQKILEDIHAQKYKVIIDQKYFQDLDIELMTYLYSYLPHRLALDIGANRGDVSSRLLQAGYQVYAFEPFPPVIDKLKNCLGDHPNFRLFPFALGS
ncbi:MAG: FkbM family methyltransferase, partial [Microcystis aeruginosa]